ncbi:MAG: right-handed parallel beta-helix repeat-containing protein [Desulfobulbaceae bacterium]|nr:right-handed parallel beta-helix repeat-containing protein [Desulfobulbaceae bacterium]
MILKYFAYYRFWSPSVTGVYFLFIFCSFLVLNSSFSAQATIITVPDDYKKIEQAIKSAVTGDTILVDAGSYLLGYGNIVIAQKILTLKSIKGSSETIITGRGDRPVINVLDKSKAIIEGFTITSKVDVDYSVLKGGGIYCASSSTPTIAKNIIKGNRAVFGGAIYCAEGSSPIILDNEIVENEAMTSGGGVFSFKASPEVFRNKFIANLAGNSGGAVFCNRDRAIVTNNIMWKNKARFGGGVACDRAAAAILNNSIIENEAAYGGGIMVDGGPVRIINVILWKNTGDFYFKGYSPFSKPAFSNISDGDFMGTNGNISIDPLFKDLQNGDFSFQEKSPCINTGNPEPVFFDPDGSVSDIGAFGGPKAYVEK